MGKPPTAPRENVNSDRPLATDFSQSFCHFTPRDNPTWVRMELECRCEVVDPAGGRPDEYLLGVRTQDGLQANPASGSVEAGYDCWMIFSRKRVYIRRSHASSYPGDSSQVEPDFFAQAGWHVASARATLLRSAAQVREAIFAWRPIVGRMEFARADGTAAYAIEFPVKWCDAYLAKDGFRVETGAVLLLDPERVAAGKRLEFDDFQWAYLDFRDFQSVRCFLERPTSVIACTLAPAFRDRPPGPQRVAQIESRLYEGWQPPIPAESLRKVFQTNHYSVVKQHVRVATQLYVLDEPADHHGH